MGQEAVVIPDKIYFKIGEVCDLVGVQAHVLRYWETEFSALSPQKNKSGQRSYRKRDVEMALRIKQLLYNEMFTIAGARKKLQSDLRDPAKAKEKTVAATEPKPISQVSLGPTGAPLLFDAGFATESSEDARSPVAANGDSVPVNVPAPTAGIDREALKKIAKQLLEIRAILER